MKRYHVIKKQSSNNEHLNETDLLPASCHLITGIAVCTTVKKNAAATELLQSISFPQRLIKSLLSDKSIHRLPYSDTRTSWNAEESQGFFEIDILPSIVDTLVEGIQYPILSLEQQNTLSNNIYDLLMGTSDQEEIDWDQLEQDLQNDYQGYFFDDITALFGLYGINPEEDIDEQYVSLLFIPASRTYALSRITYDIYYKLQDKGYFHFTYSNLLRDISTSGNSIMQNYDSSLAILQEERKAYEAIEPEGLMHYLYTTADIYGKGQKMNDDDFADLIANETLLFLYQNRSHLFVRPVLAYQRPKPYECGTLSLLVNGNSFLLRDFILTANRRIKHLSKEIIPFSEPLEVNSNLQIIYKSNFKSGAEPLNIRIYIQYEDFKEPLSKLEIETEEIAL